nr:hypothetical protein PanWU01x14_046150 [Ipomoea batatas]
MDLSLKSLTLSAFNMTLEYFREAIFQSVPVVIIALNSGKLILPSLSKSASNIISCTTWSFLGALSSSMSNRKSLSSSSSMYPLLSLSKMRNALWRLSSLLNFVKCTANNGLGDKSGSSFSVMAFGDDPIEELAALAELHQKIHSLLVFKHILVANNIGVFRQMAHDLHLPPHILHIDLRPQLALRYLLTRHDLPRFLVRAQIRHAELPPPELLPKFVLLPYVISRHIVAQDSDLPRNLLRSRRPRPVPAFRAFRIDGPPVLRSSRYYGSFGTYSI